MEMQKIGSDKAKELNIEFENLKQQFTERLSKDFIDSLDLLDIEKNNLSAIYNSIQIKNIPIRLLRFKISQMVNNILLQTDKKPENQKLLYDLIAQDVYMNFKNLGIEEIYYAMYFGIRSKYGEVYYFDAVTVFKWISNYQMLERNRLIRIVNKNTKQEKLINKELIHHEWLKYKITQINEYIENDIPYSIKDINNSFFKYVLKKGLITDKFIANAIQNIDKIKELYQQEYKPSLIDSCNLEEITKKLFLFYWIRERKKENKLLNFNNL